MTSLRQTLRTADALADNGLIHQSEQEDAAHVAARYAIAVTPAMAELIDRSNPSDPIGRQFIPDRRELDLDPSELSDPIGDRALSPVKGLVHRYRDRVLLKVVGVCPVYCRFCFRREMVGPELGESLSSEEHASALAYIRAHSEVREVILTGGDPFILSARRAEEITRTLSAIEHLTTLRWHTRVPVVAPERVTAELVSAMTATTKGVVVAIHTNHPRELTAAARTAIARLSQAGVRLLSQTVLLKGINDDPGTLARLMRDLVGLGVAPYYLHHGDLAPGTSHFRTSLAAGQEIMRALRHALPAHAIPTYVLDIPGGYGKVPIEGEAFRQRSDGRYEVIDRQGARHIYPGT